MINQTDSGNTFRARDDGRSLQVRVVEAIGTRIASGEYVVGKPLPREAEFFSAFGISRPVLREALRALAAKGMVRARPRIGTVVQPREHWNLMDADVLQWIARRCDIEDLRQLTEIRAIIEPGAAQLAAARLDPGRIRRLTEAFERMVAHVADTPKYLEADKDFHLAILAASQNDYLISIGSLISTSLQSSLQVTNPSPDLNRASLGIHEEILRAIRAGDGAKAAQASRVQLEDALKRINQYGRRQARVVRAATR